MKKLIVLAALLIWPPFVFANDVWLSSNTATSTGGGFSVLPLCTATQRGVLHGVCTDFGVAASSITIVNSTFTFVGVNIIGPVSTLVADQCKYFDTVIPKGMGYHKPNTATVTILYNCY